MVYCCQETGSGDYTRNRLRILVCVYQWSVKCSHKLWGYKWSINRVTNFNSLYSHSYTWQYLLILWACIHMKYSLQEKLSKWKCERNKYNNKNWANFQRFDQDFILDSGPTTISWSFISVKISDISATSTVISMCHDEEQLIYFLDYIPLSYHITSQIFMYTLQSKHNT
jgi:hypothetical protein